MNHLSNMPSTLVCKRGTIATQLHHSANNHHPPHLTRHHTSRLIGPAELKSPVYHSYTLQALCLQYTTSPVPGTPQRLVSPVSVRDRFTPVPPGRTFSTPTTQQHKRDRVYRPVVFVADAHLCEHLLSLTVLQLYCPYGAQVEQVAAVLCRYTPGVSLLGLAAELLSLGQYSGTMAAVS